MIPRPAPPRRPLRAVAALALAAVVPLAACTEPPAEPELPAHALPYLFYYPELRYEFVDSTPNNSYRLDWVGGSASTFQGYNCVILIPRTPGDTIGEVIFRIRGANQGRLVITNAGGADSANAFFLAQDFPTRGRFVVTTAGALTIIWDDGQPSRYFAPEAILRIAQDTLYSDVRHDFTNGFVTWHVAWVHSIDCP